jgi:hypothetical protein
MELLGVATRQRHPEANPRVHIGVPGNVLSTELPEHALPCPAAFSELAKADHQVP